MSSDMIRSETPVFIPLLRQECSCLHLNVDHKYVMHIGTSLVSGILHFPSVRRGLDQ